MLKKVMKSLVNNLGLKILSILIAVGLWMVVVNLDDPEITKRYSIPVTVLNSEVLEESGKVYDVVDESDIAVFNVTGKRSYVDNLSGSDFTATADLSQIIELNSNSEEKFVPIYISSKRYENKLTISAKTINMRITIEDLSTEQSYVVCETTGTPAEGYAIGEATVSPNLIKISGPQSVVSKVSRIVAGVSVDGLTEDITASVNPVLYDDKNNVIESTQIKLSQDRVTVSVQILGTKIIPVKCETTGIPADGYQFVGLEYAPETIAIKAEPSVLNNVHQITIPGEAINLEGATGDVENNIDITAYLSDMGVSLVNPEENKIAVKALVERLERKTYNLPIDAITINNPPEEYEVSYGSTEISVPIRGRSSELAELAAEQIHASIDLEGLEVGTHSVTVEIVVDERFQLLGMVTLRVHIKEKPEETDEPTSEEDANGDTGDGNDDAGGSDANKENDDAGGSDANKENDNDSSSVNEEDAVTGN